MNIGLGTIDTAHVSRTFNNIAKLHVKNTTGIIARVESIGESNPENLSITFSATLILESFNESYGIAMPCFIQTCHA